MFAERSYLRDRPPADTPSVLKVFLGLLAGVFVLQKVVEVWFSSYALLEYGALTASGLAAGRFWTLLTYALLHGNIYHLLFNGLGLYFVLRILEDELPTRRVVQAMIFSALGAAGLWLALNAGRAGSVIGASGILMGLLAVFASMHPRRTMTMFIFFVIPVRIQPRWFIALLAAVDLGGLLLVELPGRGSLYGVAHSAHLGGLGAGALYYYFVLARGMRRGSAATVIEPPAWFRRQGSRPPAPFAVNLTGSGRDAATRPSAAPSPRDALRVEVDRILDKINTHGFGSLTAAEKRALDEARQQMPPR
jgi:membrane associated rhomboid family serine protease